MHSNITSKELEMYLSGEYAGRIYNIKKFMPVLNVLKEKGDIPAGLIDRMIGKLSKSKNKFIYFNSKTSILFGLKFNLSGHNGLSLDVIKLQNRSEPEIRKFCANLFQIIPLAQINIVHENERFKAEQEADKIAV